MAFTLHPDDTIVFEQPNQSAPDLGFIRLNEEQASSLKAIFSFVSLNKETPELHADRLQSIEEVFILSGGFEEMTTKTSRQDNTAKLKLATHLTDGTILSHRSDSGFDYLIFQPKPFEREDPLPNSFAATSGGGLWRCDLVWSTEGKLLSVNKKFIGVAFYESGHRPNQITCHGIESIYSKLKDKIFERWPKG